MNWVRSIDKCGRGVEDDLIMVMVMIITTAMRVVMVVMMILMNAIRIIAIIIIMKIR